MNVFEQLRFEFVVIGGGPAGVSGAIAAGILGKRVALIEKEAVVGGAGINTFHGSASFVDTHTIRVVSGNGVEMLVHGEKILIATGSSPLRPPEFPTHSTIELTRDSST